ncbi:hypothetical protein O181_099913 [Austropuccinia psidii MF-1]|uniref:Tet-like 2OG-Fe(II) oxygenase domain-containing protein n=1 Tax=Austropuccinia psidii MF-1 TaxID=1389203 RepID=A0A9Q3JBS4_9BASI|nr:hypothetical protein [Austropuccinia psidii MF-1]
MAGPRCQSQLGGSHSRSILRIFKCEADIPANKGAFKFVSALTFTMNGFKNSPHLDKDAALYALGWWFQADKQTGQIQRDASKRCTGGKLIFPNEHFWFDLSKCHGLIQVVWASSTFAHYTDSAKDNESTTLIGQAAEASHANIHACTSSQQFKQLPTPVQAPDASHKNPYVVQVVNNLNISLRQCRLSIAHTLILTLVQAPDNSNNSLRWCRIWTIHMRMLMLVQVPTILKIPYACAGFQQFTCKFLCL